MKKKFMILICLVMIAALALSAAADGTLGTTAVADKTEGNRGDEFTVTVSVGEITARSGGVTANFDSAVLELVSGEILLEGTSTKNWGMMSPNQGVFVYAADQAISGAVAKCTFKIKDDAAFAATDISFSVKVGDVTETAAVTVTVVCVHSYDAWVMVDDNTHTHTCSICSVPETKEHTWKVTEEIPATCAAEGSKTSKCDDCGHTKTETLPKLTEHAWNAGEITKPSTCTAEGEKTFTCTVCSAVRTEPLAMASHTYTGRCDADCNVCGATREITHKYGTEWKKDENGHWHECTYCGHRKDEAGHKPGAEPTEQTSQNCTVCGYIVKEALGHTHNYQVEWTSDENGHWHACAGCENKGELAEHIFDNACDKDCNICGFIRETEHIFYENYMSDATGHWHECRICGYRLEKEAHLSDEQGKCGSCGYNLTSNHDHSYLPQWQWDPAGHWQVCDCGEKSTLQAHSWDEGVVTKTPTETEDGARTHKCTVCGAQRVELIHAGTAVPNNDLWLLLLIGGGVVVVGVVIFVIVGIIAGKKKAGRYSQM